MTTAARERSLRVRTITRSDLPWIPRSSIAAVTAVLLHRPAQAVEGKIGKYSDAVVQGHVLEPRKLEPTDANIGKIKAPDGFRVSVFARDLINPRMLAVGEDGTVYATRRSVGDVIVLKDTDGDGTADQVKTVAGRPNMHGIAIHGRKGYLATVRDVYVAEIKEDGSFGELRRIINDLPDSGQHPNRTLAIGPDGMLYITVGSTATRAWRAVRKARRFSGPSPTARVARSMPRDCATRSDSAGTRRQASCGAWITASTGSATTRRSRS